MIYPTIARQKRFRAAAGKCIPQSHFVSIQLYPIPRSHSEKLKNWDIPLISRDIMNTGRERERAGERGREREREGRTQEERTVPGATCCCLPWCTDPYACACGCLSEGLQLDTGTETLVERLGGSSTLLRTVERRSRSYTHENGEKMGIRFTPQLDTTRENFQT